LEFGASLGSGSPCCAPGSSRRDRRAPTRRRRLAASRPSPTAWCVAGMRSSLGRRCRGSRTSRSTRGRAVRERWRCRTTPVRSHCDRRCQTPSIGDATGPVATPGTTNDAAKWS
jgi:hypothetical protein